MKLGLMLQVLGLVLLALVSRGSAADISVLFSFDPPEGSAVAGYEMYSDQNRICQPTAAEVTPEGEDWTFVCGPAPTGWHDFAMRAVYENGQNSPFSASFPFYVGGDGPVVIHVKVVDSDGRETIFIPEP